MKKVLAMVAFVMIGVIVYAFNDENRINVDQQSKKEVKSGEVIVMNKEMFIKDVFDYEKVKNGNTKVTNLPLSTSTPTGAVLAA